MTAVDLVSQSTERSRAWQRCTFPPLKAQLPHQGTCTEHYRLSPHFVSRLQEEKKGSEEGRKKQTFLLPWPVAGHIPMVHWTAQRCQECLVWFFLQTKVVIVSKVCRGRKANIVLCESEWKGKARLRQAAQHEFRPQSWTTQDYHRQNCGSLLLNRVNGEYNDREKRYYDNVCHRPWFLKQNNVPKYHMGWTMNHGNTAVLFKRGSNVWIKYKLH